MFIVGEPQNFVSSFSDVYFFISPCYNDIWFSICVCPTSQQAEGTDDDDDDEEDDEHHVFGFISLLNLTERKVSIGGVPQISVCVCFIPLMVECCHSKHTCCLSGDCTAAGWCKYSFGTRQTPFPGVANTLMDPGRHPMILGIVVWSVKMTNCWTWLKQTYTYKINLGYNNNAVALQKKWGSLLENFQVFFFLSLLARA